MGLVSFVFVLAIRNALIYKLIWERGETFVKEVIDYSNLVLPYPELGEFLQLPSFADIMLVGVPMILMKNGKEAIASGDLIKGISKGLIKEGKTS